MPSVWAAFGVLLGALLAWILVLDLLNRAQVAPPLYQVVVLALIAATILVILVLSPGVSTRSARLGGLLDFRGSIVPGVALALTNLFLWQAHQRHQRIWASSMWGCFRFGLLLLVIGGAITAPFYGADQPA
jgi:hypothetical protein